MAEWSIATVLKTAEGNTSGGSNPSFSANVFIKKAVKESFIDGFFSFGKPTDFLLRPTNILLMQKQTQLLLLRRKFCF